MDREIYIRAGDEIAATIVAACAKHAPGSRTARVLDFGCGPGRVARRIKTAEPSFQLYGTDIDREAIGWAQANLADMGTFSTNPPLPPMDYQDEAFDVIYTVSVFTHLDESSQLDWLAELARILKPGGILLASVHGALTRATCTTDETALLALRGFVYRVGRRGPFKLDGLPDSYQTTFHSRTYVESTWTRWFDIVEYIEGGITAHQDLVVLSQRSDRARKGSDTSIR